MHRASVSKQSAARNGMVRGAGQASLSECFKRSNVFIAHLKPWTVTLHHATVAAIRNKGCDCALTDTHESDTPRKHGTVADSAQRI